MGSSQSDWLVDIYLLCLYFALSQGQITSLICKVFRNDTRVAWHWHNSAWSWIARCRLDAFVALISHLLAIRLAIFPSYRTETIQLPRTRTAATEFICLSCVRLEILGLKRKGALSWRENLFFILSCHWHVLVRLNAIQSLSLWSSRLFT